MVVDRAADLFLGAESPGSLPEALDRLLLPHPVQKSDWSRSLKSVVGARSLQAGGSNWEGDGTRPKAPGPHGEVTPDIELEGHQTTLKILHNKLTKVRPGHNSEYVRTGVNILPTS